MVADRSKIVADRIESTFPHRYFLSATTNIINYKKEALLETAIIFYSCLSIAKAITTNYTN